MRGRLTGLAVLVLLLLYTPPALRAQTTDAPVTSLTKEQVQKLIGLCAAHGHREHIKPEVADFLKLARNDDNGFEAATAKFRNGDQCTFVRLGKARDGYLFARTDGGDGFTCIFHLDRDLGLIAGLKVRFEDGRIAVPPEGLSSAQAAVELPKIYSEWVVILDHFEETAAE
jgi:hypothetical protein